MGSQGIIKVAPLILDISVLVLLIPFSHCPITQSNNGSSQLFYATNKKSLGIVFKEAPIITFIFANGETEALRCITNVPRRPKCCQDTAYISRALAQEEH